jgi:phospholipase/carboxylesterase
MKSLRLAGLDALVVTKEPQPHADDSSKPGCVVLLHGYGAPATDLVPLAHELDAPAGTHLVFPAAPHALDLGMPGFDGRAWWPIDMLRLQIAVQTRNLEGLANERPEGIVEVRQTLSAFLDALLSELNVAPERLVLGGFSQGAMLSCDLALRETRPLGGLVLLSGTLISRSEWLPLMSQRAGLPVFQSHSPDDQVLPYSLAQELHADLRRAGADAEFVPFRGGHGIGGPVLPALSQFLARVLS